MKYYESYNVNEQMSHVFSGEGYVGTEYNNGNIGHYYNSYDYIDQYSNGCGNTDYFKNGEYIGYKVHGECGSNIFNNCGQMIGVSYDNPYGESIYIYDEE